MKEKRNRKKEYRIKETIYPQKHGKRIVSLIYLCFSGISIIAVGFLLFFSLSSLFINETVITTKQSVEQSGKYVEVYIERVQNIASLLSENSDVVEFFSHENNLEQEDYIDRINDLIVNVIKTDTTIQSIVIISKDGKLFSNEAGLDMSMSEDMMKEDWYVNAIHSEMPKLTSARMQNFSMDKETWVISLSKEILDKNGNNIGVVVLDIPYTTIESYLMHLQLGENGKAFILNGENELVFHQDASYYENAKLKESLVEVKNGKNTYSSETNTLVSQYEIKNTDWVLVGICEVESIPVIRRQVIETILLGFAFIFLGVLITTMILNRLTDELKKKEEDIHKQEMEVLYSQINPHFLYNTLETIIWQAEFNQSEDVIQTTKSLASFFRLSLNKGEKLTSIRDELEHVTQYLQIQKQRYQEKLNYEIYADEELLDVMIPKIILQPIVENAIYHGIKEMDREGNITIRLYRIKGSIRDFDIVIKDNGVGFVFHGDKDILPEAKEDRLGGVGLQNVQKRIKIYFGEEYGVEIHSLLGKGTEVTLHLREI